MSIRINSEYQMHGHAYRVKVHDIEYGGAPMQPECMNLVTSDTVSDPDETIVPRVCELTFLKQNTEAWIEFIEALETFEMNRFYVTVERYRGGGYSYIFKGQVVQDLLSISDNYNSELRIIATDGMSLLKGFKCTGMLDDINQYPPSFWRRLKHIFWYILNNIQTVKNLYADTDILFTASSNLQIDDTYFSANENPFEVAWLSNYFLKGPSNEEGSFLNLYDVLKEILDRCHLRIYYDDGIYKIVGKEQLQENPAGNTFAYDKTGELVSSTPPESFPTALPIGTDTADDVFAWEDGTIQVKSGYKEVTVITNDQLNGQWQGTGVVLESFADDIETSDNILTVESTATTEIGELVPNQRYSLIFDVEIKIEYIPTFPLITKRYPMSVMFLIEVEDSSGGGWVKWAMPQLNPILDFTQPMELGEYDKFTFIAFKTYPYNYTTQVHFILPESSSLRRVRVRMMIENFRKENVDLPYVGDPPYLSARAKSTLKLGPENQEEIFAAYYYGKNSNQNMRSKTISLLAGTKYAGPAAKMWVWNGVIGNPARILTDKFRLSSGDPYESIEDSMIRHTLKYYGRGIKTMELEVRGYVKNGEYVEFRGVEYFVYGSTINHFTFMSKLKLLKKSAPILDFDIFLTKPKTKSPAALTNDIYANSSNYNNTILPAPELYKYYNQNVTEIEIPYDMPEATEDSYHLAVRVEANGVFMYVDQELDPAKRQAFRVDWATNKIKFNLAVRGRVFIWVYPQFFNTNVSTS